MISFWLAAAALVALALVFLLPPLLRRAAREEVSSASTNLDVLRDQLRELDADLARGTISSQQHAQAKQELERRLVDEVGVDTHASFASEKPAKRGLAIAVALLVPIAAASIYWTLGNPSALVRENRTGMSAADEADRQKMLELTQRLADKMRERPDDPVGWLMLGRAYKMTGQFAEAVNAFARSIQIKSDDPNALAEYAEATLLARNGQLDPQAEAALQKALQLDPKHERALALAGTAAYEAKRYKDAIAYWERLLQQVPRDSEFAQSLAAGIVQARAELGAKEPTTDPDAKSVSGVVTLSESLRATAQPEDTVYIFARAAGGPKMPLAIQRVHVKDLPFKYALDDSMAMSPQAKLSSAGSVIIGARVSRSGNPMAQPGDLEGLSNAVKPGTKDVTVTIDKVVN